ncbi:MAG: sensor histidine kinase [Rhodospirillales bacterium]
MQSVIEYLFGAASFMPHGYCLLWRPDLVALHAVSDALIFLAYASIPAALVVLVRKRPDIEHRSTVVLFATFILACGFTHLMGMLTLWQPMYGLQGLVKALTAIVSVLVAVAIWPLLPKLLKVPSPSSLQALNADLEKVNADLKREIAEHEATLVELRDMRRELEDRVGARTRELNAAYRDLERVNDDLSTFVHVASHDLKEPLRGIRQYAEIVADDHADTLNEQGRKDICAIIRLADRSVDLINSLRDYSRAGNTDEAVEDVDLGSVLNEALDNLQPVIRETGMQVDVPRKLPVLRCARAHALALMQNLISNAAKHHGPRPPFVRVEADAAADGTVSIVVSDNGPGIPREMEEDIFKMFRRLADPRDSAERGHPGDGARSTGMGLAIVKRIVERYNGTVNLRPSADGGAVFELLLKAV